ncbi:MAG: hypothetical protein CO108_12695, partial [Deltaproteobacteria bacterium CG_4_9_14_3_um_filter_63_12]
PRPAPFPLCEVFIRNDLDGAIAAVREAIKWTEDAADRDQYEILLQAMRCYHIGEYALSGPSKGSEGFEAAAAAGFPLGRR